MRDDTGRAEEILACPFCRIAGGTSTTQPFLCWDDAVAITPLNPVAPGHMLVIPNVHVRDAAEDPDVTASAMRRAAELAAGRGDMNVITSIGPAATQTVRHLHVHLVPRTEGDGLKLPWTGQERAEPKSPKPRKPVSVGTGMPATAHLEAFGESLRDAFGAMPYHVGSSVQGKTWRDVDVRIMLPDDRFDALFPGYKAWRQRDAFWALMCAGISELGRKRTGLPVDFQIQRTTEANEMFDGPRNALFLHRVEDDCRPEMLPAAEPVVPASARFATDGDRKSFLAMFGGRLDDWFTPEFAAFVRTGPQPVVPRERAVNRDDADGDA
jgi:diadenosine tetraphosphate (Ap4A) HIT family hydrolase